MVLNSALNENIRSPIMRVMGGNRECLADVFNFDDFNGYEETLHRALRIYYLAFADFDRIHNRGQACHGARKILMNESYCFPLTLTKLKGQGHVTVNIPVISMIYIPGVPEKR